MNSKTVIEHTPEELERKYKRLAREAAEEAIEKLDDVYDRIRAGHAFFALGVADRAMLAEALGISKRQIRRLDKKHSFRRVEGPTSDRPWYDVEDVREKLLGDESNP